jgi:hypothetical protein
MPPVAGNIPREVSASKVDAFYKKNLVAHLRTSTAIALPTAGEKQSAAILTSSVTTTTMTTTYRLCLCCRRVRHNDKNDNCKRLPTRFADRSRTESSDGDEFLCDKLLPPLKPSIVRRNNYK